MKILIVNGKYRLANSKLVLTTTPVGGPQSPTTLTLNDVKTSKTGVLPVIQRKAGQTYADVPVLYSFTGSQPTNIEARVVKSSDGTTEVRTWTRLTQESWGTGTGFGMLTNVPQGRGYLLQIRDGLNPTNITSGMNGATPWGIGTIWLYAGQSNMVRTLGGGTNYNDIVPDTSSTEFAYFNAGNVNGAIFDDVGWHAPSNGSSNGVSGSGNDANTATGNIIKFLRIVSTRLKAVYNTDIPVAIIPWAFSNQPIEKFLSVANGGDGVHYNDLFAGSGTSGTTIGLASPRNIYAGDFEGVLWHQGEFNHTDTELAYRTKLNTLYNQYLSYVGNFGRTSPNFFFGAAVLGNYDVTACWKIENIRTAVLKSGFATWTTIDLPRSDLYHIDTPYQKRSMMRCIQTVLKFLGCASVTGKGPSLNESDVAHSSNTAVLTVNHDGGTSLTTLTGTSTPTGFYANTAADFTGTDVNVTATITGSNQITLTFDAGQTFPVYVKYLGGLIGSTVVDGNGYTASCNPNISNCVYDNLVYPTDAHPSDQEAKGLPLLPTIAAIKIT